MAHKKSKPPDNLSELANFLGEQFDATNERLDRLESMFRDLQGSVDAYAKRADAYFQEMTMLAHRVDRHEKWIQQIAEKLGVKLRS